MKTAAALLAAACAAGAQAAEADSAPAAWLFAAHSIHHNDALPLAAMDHDDHRQLAPRPGRNLAYIDEEARIERRSGDWAFALLARSQATLVADGQTLQLARMIETGQRPDADMHWRADARFRGFTGAGVELRYSQAIDPRWTVELSSQLLALGQWHERRIHGAASYEARSGSYDFDVASDDLNNRLHFDYQQPSAPHGTGLLLGAGLRWTDGPTTLRLDVRDAGWLHWSAVPQQALALAAHRQGVDADGFVEYGPLLEGRNSQPGATRPAPWRASAALEQTIAGDQRIGAGIDVLADYGPLPWLRWGRRIGSADFRLDWRLHERRLTAGLDWHGLTLRVGADQLGAAAHSRELMIGYRLSLP